MVFRKGTAEERFWQSVIKTEDCWLWNGDPKRRGQLLVGSDFILAYRFSYELHIGPIPEGLQVCHKCDTAGCVRPDHLFVGTNLENVRDMMRKGRNPKGVTHYTHLKPELIRRGSRTSGAKLTEEAVSSARKERKETNATVTSLARKHGVSVPAMCEALSGKKWGHVK